MKCHQNMSESWTHYKQILELWGRCSSSGPWSKEVILTGVLWDQSWCVPVHQQWEYIMYSRDTNLGMHHVTNSIYSCLWLLMNDGLMVWKHEWYENMKLYMFSKLLCTYFPYQRHNTPAYAYIRKSKGEAQAESQTQESQDQHHSTPGWALPRAVSEMIIHLRTSYGLHTNHQIQLGEDDFLDILGDRFWCQGLQIVSNCIHSGISMYCTSVTPCLLPT